MKMDKGLTFNLSSFKNNFYMADRENDLAYIRSKQLLQIYNGIFYIAVLILYKHNPTINVETSILRVSVFSLIIII